MVQECAKGLITLEERDNGAWAFAAPPARITPLTDAQQKRLADVLAPAVIDFSATPCAVDNGAPWLVVRLTDAQACLDLVDFTPTARDALTALVDETHTHGLVLYGPHDGGEPATFELRALMFGAEKAEDPVTGSANAALAMLLDQQGKRPGNTYTVRQGTALGRDGRVSIAYDDRASGTTIWVGGHAVTIIDGTFSF
jgi:PhzF family phenazine biosynthesis protein